MVRGIEGNKKKKKGLTSDKDYISEAYLHGGKAIAEIIIKKNKKKINKNQKK